MKELYKDKKMKIVFISGPLTTGGDGSCRYIESNIKKAEEFSVALANAGVGFFCAHSHTSFHHEKGSIALEKFYYDLDFQFLMRIADAVLAVPGWEKSFGDKEEIEWAQNNNIPVFFPKNPEDIDNIKQWAKD